MGAWIEIGSSATRPGSRLVAPHVGAWIEIGRSGGLTGSEASHPTWVRGLKCIVFIQEPIGKDVAPHVGAWIEIYVDF